MLTLTTSRAQGVQDVPQLDKPQPGTGMCGTGTQHCCHPKGMARVAFPACGTHRQWLFTLKVPLENISLLFQPPEHIALAQAENPLCPVLGAASRGSGQLWSRVELDFLVNKPFPTPPSTLPASSAPSALLVTPGVP